MLLHHIHGYALVTVFTKYERFDLARGCWMIHSQPLAYLATHRSTWVPTIHSNYSMSMGLNTEKHHTETLRSLIVVFSFLWQDLGFIEEGEA